MFSDDHLHDLISDIYDAAIDPLLWHGVLEDVCRTLDVTGFNIFALEKETGLVSHSQSVGIPDDLLEEYNSYYVTIDPGIDYVFKNPEQKFYYNYLHTKEGDMDRHEYYNWLEKAGGARYYLAQMFDFNDGMSIFATAQRSKEKGHAQDQNFKQMEIVSRHLEKAIRINGTLNQLSFNLNTAFHTLEKSNRGIFLLDDKGCVIFANSKADQLINDQDGLCLTHKKLKLNHLDDDKALQQVLHHTLDTPILLKATHSDTIRARRPSGKLPYALQAFPFQTRLSNELKKETALILIVSDPQAPFEDYQTKLETIFQLTAKEAKVASMLGQGIRADRVADQLGISINTIKSHRKKIFEKLGIESHIELVRITHQL